MHRFPYITDYVNDVFAKERTQWDFILLRPVLLVNYFFLRFVSFPIKFVLHRWSFGFEAYLIDLCMALGLKYLARPEAAELFLRHVQIEPLLYRHILQSRDEPAPVNCRKLNGIDGDFGVDDLATVLANQLTIGHDLLSYEVVERFDKQTFLDNLDYIRSRQPADHEACSKAVLEENRRCSFRMLGPTNVVMLIVTAITIFGDLNTTITALNSFGSDSLLLWCAKTIYADNRKVQIDLDFFMQEVANRGHYNNSAFFSNPSQYLYYHIVFDEVVYDLFRNVDPAAADAATRA
ncbi:DUF6999 family protein [Lignipirellula cremea]|uniref:Uncharacterized protein n=1 Tax=Lignipirellula cremea TaxID=2528010 RepID=A0A518DZM4_9BACT|nr:hypothetical protein [Lignipirellula cremea]QDU97261.1 hypothetical protein Pla8534_51060 [Lignipirellula cremea]